MPGFENEFPTSYILEINHLKKTYRYQPANILAKSRSFEALDDISFKIKQGEIFGLVGESGCGKSTLGRSVFGLIPDIQGEIRLDGEIVTSTRKISEKAQIVFQDPLSSLNPRKKIGWILEEPLKIHKIGNKETRIKRVNQILDLIGLDTSYRERYPHELSGGQRQRISIGTALMLNPKLIVADEPVSALDVSVQAQILNLLQELHEKLNLAYLFISHNLNVVYYMCDRVAVMYLGRVVELATVGDIYDHPLHPYTKALLGAIPDVRVEKKEEQLKLDGEATDSIPDFKGCAFYPRCPKAIAGICRDVSPELIETGNKNGPEHLVRCHLIDT
jgi:oligopeptide/dipeptide ABC transporter, ATP-binding protein, C-terminal domain